MTERILDIVKKEVEANGGKLFVDEFMIFAFTDWEILPFKPHIKEVTISN
jgi:hypothetical protein